MTDNVTTVANVFATVPVGTTFATDNVAGVQYQLVKVGFGLNDTWTYVSTTNPLPITLANTGANATAVKVDGSAVTQPVSLSGNQAINVVQVAGAAIAQGHGTAASAVRVELPTDGTGQINAVQSGTWTVNQGGSWTITANSGTNLNTSALALESGGNLATIAGAVIAQEATTSGVKGIEVFGAVTTAKPTYTTAKSDALSLDTSGLLRVSVADTPANTNKFLVTPDSVALPLHQSVNVDQLNGTTTDTNSGTKSAGTLRVVIATDQPQLTNKLLVTPDSVALPANQSVNVSQVGGNNTLTNNGVSGSGSQRINLASDNTAIANWGQGATGSAVPSGAQYLGGLAKTALPTAGSDGNLTGAMVDKFGRQVILPQTIRDLIGTQTTTISASTSETTIVTAAASTFNDLMMLIISNTSASTNTRIDFRDTTGGTVLFSLESIGGAAPIGFALGGVAIPQTSVNTNWTAQCATSTTDVRIYAVFAKNK